MAKYAIDGTTLTDIADAIRNKNASSEKMTPAEMAAAIANIQGGINLLFSAFEIITYRTPNKIIKDKWINHSLGVVPDGYFMVVAEKKSTYTAYSIVFVLFDRLYHESNNDYAALYLYQDSNGYGVEGWIENTDLSAFADENQIRIPVEGNCILPSGTTYQIIVYKR